MKTNPFMKLFFLIVCGTLIINCRSSLQKNERLLFSAVGSAYSQSKDFKMYFVEDSIKRIVRDSLTLEDIEYLDYNRNYLKLTVEKDKIFPEMWKIGTSVEVWANGHLLFKMYFFGDMSCLMSQFSIVIGSGSLPDSYFKVKKYKKRWEHFGAKRKNRGCYLHEGSSELYEKFADLLGEKTCRSDCPNIDR